MPCATDNCSIISWDSRARINYEAGSIDCCPLRLNNSWRKGAALAASDPKAAETKYLEASGLDANLASARIGLAELLLEQGRGDETRAILDELEQRGFLEPEAEKLKAQLHLAAPTDSTVDLPGLRAAASDPKNLAAVLALAEGLASQAQYEEALATALSVVQSGKKEFVEPARQLMVDVFRLLPDDSPLVTDYRRRLSTAL